MPFNQRDNCTFIIFLFIMNTLHTKITCVIIKININHHFTTSQDNPHLPVWQIYAIQELPKSWNNFELCIQGLFKLLTTDNRLSSLHQLLDIDVYPEPFPAWHPTEAIVGSNCCSILFILIFRLTNMWNELSKSFHDLRCYTYIFTIIV